MHSALAVAAAAWTLDWDTAKQLSWGSCCCSGRVEPVKPLHRSTGLSRWIGEQVGALSALPLILIVVVATLLVLL